VEQKFLELFFRPENPKTYNLKNILENCELVVELQN